ncbi:MAG: hypothetical protein OXE95_09305 [Chloroflexi bacterium]|nr:hypothetical protein [Chloroflexota bacterium]MCY4247754.1 hypothetical protein [Chloroflexota bacterium]
MTPPDSASIKPDTFDHSALARGLGEAPARLTALVAKHAQGKGHSLCLVGGVVRDLLLERGSADLDFVIDSDAAAFARGLQTRYGGRVAAHKPFGTAKWSLDAESADRLGLSLAGLPQHIDFARARNEVYAEPAALPSTKPGSIEDDMRRRDFSVNALALRLSPGAQYGQLLDVCGGLPDLRNRQIRALHARSFIDDPTRILRALRFATRLNFAIDAQTNIWLRDALPLLKRVSGARLRNEIEQIFGEKLAGKILLGLHDVGAWQALQPGFRLSKRLAKALRRAQEQEPPWQSADYDAPTLRWCLLLAGVEERAARRIAIRLDLNRQQIASISATCRILAIAAELADPERRASEIAPRLEKLPSAALRAGWLLLHDSPAAQERLRLTTQRWRTVRPCTSGHDLRALGLPPGPRYKQILERLRGAWIDGDVRSCADEQALLQKLLESSERPPGNPPGARLL